VATRQFHMSSRAKQVRMAVREDAAPQLEFKESSNRVE
jgi:hypothetical protein